MLQLLSDLDDLGNLGGVLLTAERGEVVSAECKFKEQGFVFLFFQCTAQKSSLYPVQIQATSPLTLPGHSHSLHRDTFVWLIHSYAQAFLGQRKYHRCDHKAAGRNSFVTNASRGDRSAPLPQKHFSKHRVRSVRDIRFSPRPLRDGNSGRLFSVSLYRS